MIRKETQHSTTQHPGPRITACQRQTQAVTPQLHLLDNLCQERIPELVRRGVCKSNHFRKDNLQNENRFISQMSETKKSFCVHHSGPIWPWSYDYQEHNYVPNDPKTHYLVFALCIGLMFWSMSACKSPSFISVVLMQIKVILNIIFKARATVLKLHLLLQGRKTFHFIMT